MIFRTDPLVSTEEERKKLIESVIENINSFMRDIEGRAFFQEMLNILRLYRSEAYKECDIQILESYATAFYSLIMREVRSQNLLPEAERLESIVNIIKVHPSKTINSSKAARYLGITQYRLNRLSSEVYGKNFAKVISDIRLSMAMELVKKWAY